MIMQERRPAETGCIGTHDASTPARGAPERAAQALPRPDCGPVFDRLGLGRQRLGDDDASLLRGSLIRDAR